MNQRLLANGVSVLEPKGYLVGEDVESAELKRRVQELLADSHRYLVIDCQHVQYINNDGLEMLRQIEVAYVIHRGKVVFVNVEPRTKRAMKLTDLAGTLEVYNTIEQAIAYLIRLIGEENEAPA